MSYILIIELDLKHTSNSYLNQVAGGGCDARQPCNLHLYVVSSSDVDHVAIVYSAGRLIPSNT